PAACPLVLLVVHRGFSSGALGFAQRSLLFLSSLFVLGSCARCPLSFSPVSAVIWLECHWISFVRPIDFGPDHYIYMREFEFCLSCYLPPGALPKTTLKSDAACAMARGS